ncbi:type I polyketide synthase [Acanthopleuribacter pedis]|uniref:SDR family oxidoreductase n=1 Tax=Acanthopleuribacter pedis TaxID=442870 RepID=A0A8J7QG53_9BACT|nr:type I polyketide synthase [Acanthopleuribacter pedis]MBO1319415.1 SDR family oxidoreductase [Acanthopleuribacter pedis]
MTHELEHEELPGIAIVGMAGRFPGADNVTQFWDNLVDGVEGTTFFTDEELIGLGMDPQIVANPNYVKAGGCLDDIDLFDASFFGFNPREAEITDPQQRLLLETAYQALQDAAYDPERFDGRIGVFAGVGLPQYFLENLINRPDVMLPLGGHRTMIANEKGFASTLISYKLNLTGPSVNVDTACSTTLVAAHMACKSLLNYEADMVLTGGCKLRVPEKSGYWFEEGGISSPDGRCRAFDADAKGTIFGTGMGIVVLKRLDDALADGDSIYAVIKGSAINNDGAGKIGYTAPSVPGQSEVIAEAHGYADVSADSIGYVEAHGTGTQLGDPIEVEALTEAFRLSSDRTGYCALGSVKTNIGHLDNAAGVTGLMKAALTVHHNLMPATLHFKEANPQINFADSPFFVNTENRAWPEALHPRRAGVSSFGIGGTNAHMVLEQAPESTSATAAAGPQIFPVSAKTETALTENSKRLAAWLQANPEAAEADVAWTLQQGRTAFDLRRFVVTDGAAPAAEQLLTQKQTNSAEYGGQVAFLFPGQGAQHAGMTADLYQNQAVFREELDRCAELLTPHLGEDIRTLLFPAESEGEAADRINQTAYTQPALFCVGYALAKQWEHCGVTPAAMIGHSIGEYVAACLAGVFSLEDALMLVTERARLMQSQPAGHMIAVPLDAAELQPLLPEGCAIAAENAPKLCVASGDFTAIEKLEANLKAAGHAARALHTSHAFHSAMMDPILEAFRATVAKVTLSAPQQTVISNVSGDVLTAEQACDPDYWVDHLRGTVRFAEGLRCLATMGEHLFLELGPGGSLSTLTKRTLGRGTVAVASCRKPNQTGDDTLFLLNALGTLWCHGVDVNWEALHEGPRRRLHLPTYAFDRQRYWIDAKPPQSKEHKTKATGIKRGGRQPLENWFYEPTWQRHERRRRAATALSAGTNWLIFGNGDELESALSAQLREAGQTAVVVRAGEGYNGDDAAQIQVVPGNAEHLQHLVANLAENNHLPNHIVHLWNHEDQADFAATNQRGLSSLIYLVQALTKQSLPGVVRLGVYGRKLVDVSGDEPADPKKAPLLVAARVISQEHSNISAAAIDLGAADAVADHVANIIREQSSEKRYPTVAYRKRTRWLQTFTRTELPEENKASLLEKGDTYVITGGFGGIGLVTALHLAKTTAANLVLLGRTALPARETWAEVLADENGTAAIKQRIEAVQAMEAAGAAVLPLSADVADAGQMTAAFEAARERFGRIDGVFHGAGLLDKRAFTLVAETTAEGNDAHFRAKVDGLHVINDLVQAFQPRFCLLMSSISTILGGLGYLGYAAGNSTMDTFAQNQSNDPTLWLSIDWDAWSTDAPAGEKAVIDAEQGMAALDLILQAETPPRLVVSTADLDERVSDWILQEAAAGKAVKQETKVEGHARPALATDYAAPRDAIEEGLAAIWQELLGYDRIGIHDHFADLGGHSLLATQLISRIRDQFQVEMPLHELFNTPTIAGQAMVILQRAAGEAGGDELEAMLSELEGMDEAELAALLEEES